MPVACRDRHGHFRVRFVAVLVVLAAIAAANYFLIRGINEKSVAPGAAVHPADRVRDDVNRAMADYEKRLEERDRKQD